MAPQSAARGFGGSPGRANKLRKPDFGRKSFEDTSVFRKHQALYQQHVSPCLIRGDLSQAEPILKLLAQSKTGVAEVYRDLAHLSESRQRLDEAEAYRDLWLDHPSEEESELLSQAETALRLDRRQLADSFFEILLTVSYTHLTLPTNSRV